MTDLSPLARSPVLKSAMYSAFDAERPLDILLVGQVNNNYPLRRLFRDMLQVRDPTTSTMFQQDAPNHLGL